MDALDRIAQIQRNAIPGRLVAGAEILGRLWRAGQRCLGSWSLRCPCGPRASQFCASKLKWVGLFQEIHPDCDFSVVSEAPWALIEIMLIDGYFDATGLTASVQVPDADRLIKVGPKGTAPDTIFDLASIPDGPERRAAIHAVTKIQAVGL